MTKRISKLQPRRTTSKSQRSRQANRRAATIQAQQDLERHQRKCVICHHPDRQAIEEEFVHWQSAWDIANEFKLGGYRTVYRHARATGLSAHRRENLHSALDFFVERSHRANISGDCILRAMRAYSCIDSLGRWTDPPTQVNFSSAPAAGTERKIQPARSFNSGAQPVSASHQLSPAIDVIQPRSLPVAPSISHREVNSGADDGSEIQIHSDHAFESEADRGNENHLEPAIEGDRVSGS